MLRYRSIPLLSALLLIRGASAQWQSLNGGVNNEVRAFAIALDSTRLLVSGKFPYVAQDGLRVNNIAWWDGEQWSNEGLGGGNGSSLPQGDQSPAFSLAIRADTIFVGHLSDYWHGQQVLGHATMLVEGQWEQCANPNSIFYFLEANGRMFSGGVSDELYGEYAPGIYEWQNSAWQGIPNMPFTNLAQVNDVAYWHGQYYFGGVFQILGSRKMVAFDGTDQWSGLAGGVGGNFVRTVCGFRDSLYVGGFMLPGQDVQSQHIQIWDGTQWLPFFEEVNAVGQVKDIHVHDEALYIAGSFRFGTDTTTFGLIRYANNQICALGGYMSAGGGHMAFLHGRLYMALPPTNDQLSYEYIGYLDLSSVLADTCVQVSPNVQIEHSDLHASVHPNPTQASVTIDLEQHIGLVTWELSDMSGRSLLSGAARDSRITIDLSDKAAGYYIVRLYAHDLVASVRLVKQ